MSTLRKTTYKYVKCQYFSAVYLALAVATNKYVMHIPLFFYNKQGSVEELRSTFRQFYFCFSFEWKGLV